jgi:energy-coupling factor transporter ATP-binding protein EcfA2
VTNEEVILDDLRKRQPVRFGVENFIVGHKSFLSEIDKILDNISTDAIGSDCRFIVGPSGSGKSSLIKAIKNLALSKKYVVCELSADMSSGIIRESNYFVEEIFKGLRTEQPPHEKFWYDLLEEYSNNVIKSQLDEDSDSKSITEIIGILRNKVENDLLKYNILEPSFVNAIVSFVISTYLDDNESLERKALILKWFIGENLPISELNTLGISTRINDRNSFQVLQSAVNMLIIMGLSGLVILIDEFSQTIHQRLDSQVLKSYYLIQKLLDGNINRTFISIGALRETFDESDGKSIPNMSEQLLRRLPGHKSSISNPYTTTYVISSLRPTEMKELSKKIVMLYNEVHLHNAFDTNQLLDELNERCTKNGTMYPSTLIDIAFELLDEKRLKLDERDINS